VFGVYVHVPFCRDHCDYCAFSVAVGQEHLAERYSRAIERELAVWKDRGVPLPADTVYLGGGTPSRLPPRLLAEILGSIPRRPGAEVTMEVNPEDLTDDALAAWVAAGVNRISLGVQATCAHVLAGIGRRQDASAGMQAAGLVSAAGLDSWGVDLIIGSPSETDADLLQAIESLSALEMPPSQVSCYLLTVESRTRLARDWRRHPDEEVLSRRYELADEALAAHGYQWVEISNWARPGGGCRHNMATWSGAEYLGLGPSACSHWAGRRWENERSLRRWLACVEAGGSAVAESEVLEPYQVILERLVLALRTPSGVPRSALAGAIDTYPELAELLDPSGEMLVLNRRGRLLCDAVAGYLDPAALG
jgi:oxygen-independent coproporphyrinogen-3 oxidase